MDQKHGCFSRHVRIGFAVASITLAGTSQAVGGTVTYTYDDAGRLVTSVLSTGPQATYALDAAGNRKAVAKTPAVSLTPDQPSAALALSSVESKAQAENTGN